MPNDYNMNYLTIVVNIILLYAKINRICYIIHKFTYFCKKKCLLYRNHVCFVEKKIIQDIELKQKNKSIRSEHKVHEFKILINYTYFEYLNNSILLF